MPPRYDQDATRLATFSGYDGVDVISSIFPDLVRVPGPRHLFVDASSGERFDVKKGAGSVWFDLRPYFAADEEELDMCLILFDVARRTSRIRQIGLVRAGTLLPMFMRNFHIRPEAIARRRAWMRDMGGLQGARYGFTFSVGGFLREHPELLEHHWIVD